MAPRASDSPRPVSRDTETLDLSFVSKSRSPQPTNGTLWQRIVVEFSLVRFRWLAPTFTRLGLDSTTFVDQKVPDEK